jgi:putative serine/threonine protein kinase
VQVLCYPRSEKGEIDKRLEELHRIGVKELNFIGRQKIGNVNVLGKGCVGIVIAARLNSQNVALKIRRTDANRTTMEREARMLEIANSVNVGPRLLERSENFLVMELFEGDLIEDWIAHTDLQNRDIVKGTLQDALEQCFRLDKVGLDHGELSQARKHILIETRKPRILDFETASIMRKPKNLSSLCQYLFVSSHIAQRIEPILGKISLDQLKNALAAYKHAKNIDSYSEVVRACCLL